jgi:hypothetical protein
MTSLLGANVAPPRRILPAPPTAAARIEVERLLAGWDDAIAGRLFAMNIELDEPLARRRAEIETLRASHGRLRPEPALPNESDTPLHLAWWLAGERGGRVRVEILMSPHGTPLVQALELKIVGEPSDALAAVARAVVDVVNAPDPVPTLDLELGPDVDRGALARTLRFVAARHAPLTLGPAVAGDGTEAATWRLRGAHGELDLEVGRDAEAGLVTSFRLAERPPVMPPHAD